MRALTPDETAILKSRLQAGAQGHRQRVLATGRIPATDTEHDFTTPQMPWVVEMPNGQAGVLFSGDPADPAIFIRHIYFLAYDTEHSGIVTDLFPYDGYAFGLVMWQGKLLAIARRHTDGALRYRTSTDNGVTWTADAALASLALTAAQVTIGSPVVNIAFQVTTNKAGTKLLFFYVDGLDVKWRETANADPNLGWSAATDTLANIPSIGRNYGGSFSYNQGFQRTFIVCETETADTWVMACESDDGDWHANHMVQRGTLGGAWARVLNVGYGGGLSGSQGANGGLFRDELGELLFYVMTDGGEFAELWRSADSGSTWSAPTSLMPSSTVYGEGLASGCGVVISGYSGGPVHIFGGFGGYIGVGGTPPNFAYGIVHVGTGAGMENLPAWEPQILNDVGEIPGFGAFVSDTQDISDRVRVISLQKDTDMDAASFNLELANTDGAVNPNDPAAPLYQHVKPTAKVRIEQWYGDAANAVVTFSGVVSQVQGSSNAQTVIVVGLDRSKHLLKQSVHPVAPQKFGLDGADRNMGNYVYINKSLNQVLDDLLLKAFFDPLIDAVWWPSGFIFKELIFSSGSLMAACKQAALAAGLRFWADDDGIFRTAPLVGGGLVSSWTFRAREEVLTLATELDDDETYTRVSVIGKANIGAKYLQELLVWQGHGAPRGVDYDPLTGDVWYLDADGTVRLLDPEANMAVVAGPYATGLTNLDGITVDPNDDHLWISHNATYRKVSRADPTTTLLGPFAAPDGNRCGIWAWNDAAVTKLKMCTRTSEKLVTMSTAGAEISRVDSQVPKPTALSGDSGGGLYITGLDATDFYQAMFTGSVINTIKQAQKNGADLGVVDRPPTVYDFGDVYQVFEAWNAIVKYAVAGTPESVPRATLAEAINVPLEIEIGEVRRLDVVDLGITDLAMAQSMANALLREASKLRLRITQGAVGHPGLQINDRVTLVSPGDELAADFVVRSIRSDQIADGGTYLMIVVLEPYVEVGA